MDLYTLKKHFSFSMDEIRDMFVTIVFLGFCFSFRDWGSGDNFNFASGILNWFNSALVVLLVILVYVSCQRLMGIRRGYKTQYKMWFWGLLAAVLVTFLSGGYFVLAFLGTVIIFHMEGHRLGSFRYGLNHRDLGVISMVGPLSILFLGFLFKVISIAYPGELIQKGMIICLMVASVNMLPLPWIDGGNVFFGSRLLWIFTFLGIIAASALMYFLSSIWAIIFGAIAVAILGLVMWFIFFEEGF